MALKLHSLSDSVRAVISAKIQEITCTAVSAVCSCVCPPGKTVSYSCFAVGQMHTLQTGKSNGSCKLQVAVNLRRFTQFRCRCKRQSP